MTRAETKQIIAAVVQESTAIAKSVGEAMVGRIEQLVKSDMSRSDIEMLARVVIAEEVDPTNVAKQDRREDARALLSSILKKEGKTSREFADYEINKLIGDRDANSGKGVGKPVFDATGHEAALEAMKETHRRRLRLIKGE
jgi:hypothetical protein